MALTQLIREQNRLLQQLAESESANPSSALLPEPKSKQKKWKSGDLLSHWHDAKEKQSPDLEENRSLKARSTVNHMTMLLEFIGGEDSLNSDDHTKSVLEQLERLRNDLSPSSWNDLSQTMHLCSQSHLFSLCNSIQYDHPSAGEEQPSIGFVWFVLSIYL